MAQVPASSHGGSTFNGGTITNGLTIHPPVDTAGFNVRANAGTTFADLVAFQNETGAFVLEIDAADDVTFDTRNQSGTFLVQSLGGQVSVGSAGVTLTSQAGKDIQISAGGDTRITGTGLGFFGVTPVAQHAAIPDATTGVVVDAEARAALNALLAGMRSVGLIAT